MRATAALARRMGCAAAQRRGATSLPQIPGVILTNAAIQEDSLVSRVRRWAAASDVLSTRPFDLLQIHENVDGKLAPRALCGLLRTELAMAESSEPIRALVVVFYRARDFLNREFWEDQVRRLCDAVAEEYLVGHRAVQLMVHHKPPAVATGLEIGDHRLLSELSVLRVVGRPLRSSRCQAALAFVPADAAGEEVLGPHAGFHRLSGPLGAEGDRGEALAGGVRRGWYVLREAAGTAICGLRVLGAQPLQLVCGGAWALDGREADLASLVDRVRRLARRPACIVVADRRDAHWGKVTDNAEAMRCFGLWRAQRPLGVAITGVPIGLEPAEQVRLATAPFLVPWEFLPFHAGRIMLI
mmetsp:Transcript_89671/g.252796  ORF Transcript_89671/g.252796 Transcript_89671/m.252796 type:complete len:356 (+) Transcript_89671:111-1178(+)